MALYATHTHAAFERGESKEEPKASFVCALKLNEKPVLTKAEKVSAPTN